MSAAKLFNIGYISSQVISGNHFQIFLASGNEYSETYDWYTASSQEYSKAFASAQIALYESAAGNLSDLSINVDKDWNNKAIFNFSYLSGSVDSSTSPLGLWFKDEDSGEIAYFKLVGGIFTIGSTNGNLEDANHLVLSSVGDRVAVGIDRNSPNFTLDVSGSINSYSISTNSLSGGVFQLNNGIINCNTISGLSTPIWPSSASNKKYVDDREIDIESQITALTIESLTDVAEMIPGDDTVLTWDSANGYWSSQTAQGGVTYISSCTDANITGWTSGQVLTWNGTDWANKYPALTFNIANVQISANSYLNIARFNTGSDKSCYVLQASCCHSGGSSISGLRVKVIDDGATIYDTSSSSIEQGGPLAKSNTNSDMQISFMYSGTSNVGEGGVIGYKYGSAFVQVVVY